MQKGGWFFGPSKSEKTANAIDLYIKAANQFKIAKNCMFFFCFDFCKSFTHSVLGQKAGIAFNDAAQLSLETSHGNYQAASNFQKAAEMLRKVDKPGTKYFSLLKIRSLRFS